MFHRAARRRGFTLVELIAVSGLSAVLGTQILSAIVDAREAARRTQCKNNLKQIGLAFLNYHDNFNGFAIGWLGVDVEANKPDVKGMNGWGWAARLTPYIDQAPLYNQLNFSARVDSENNAKLIAKAIPTYRCPSDSFAKKTWKIKDDKDAPLMDLATSNYVASFGTDEVAKCEKMKPGEVCESDGMFFHNSYIRINDVKDGTSNTILAGERIGNDKIDHLSTWSGVIAKGKHSYARILGSSNAALNAKERHPSDYRSAHSKGAHFLLGDGAVRFVATDLDLKVFKAITTRASDDEVTDF